jgi:hypothetical protein
MPCGSATMQQSIVAVEKVQAVWPGTGARRSATQSAGGLCQCCRGRGEPSRLRAAGGHKRPEGPGRSKTEEPAEPRGVRYWRSRACSREATMSKCMSAA